MTCQIQMLIQGNTAGTNYLKKIEHQYGLDLELLNQTWYLLSLQLAQGLG